MLQESAYGVPFPLEHVHIGIPPSGLRAASCRNTMSGSSSRENGGGGPPICADRAG